MRHERSHRLDKILTAGGVKKKGQKHEALTWVFGSSDRIRSRQGYAELAPRIPLGPSGNLDPRASHDGFQPIMAVEPAKIDAAFRADFESMPSEAQAKMLDLLQKADPNHFDWWMETLIGDTPDAPLAE